MAQRTLCQEDIAIQAAAANLNTLDSAGCIVSIKSSIHACLAKHKRTSIARNEHDIAAGSCVAFFTRFDAIISS
jgi:hypothetical protein